MTKWTVKAFFTTARPVTVDAQVAFSVVAADTALDAGWLAVAMLMATRPQVQMVTRTVVTQLL